MYSYGRYPYRVIVKELVVSNRLSKAWQMRRNDR